MTVDSPMEIGCYDGMPKADETKTGASLDGEDDKDTGKWVERGENY